jgi:hypothetical protein
LVEPIEHIGGHALLHRHAAIVGLALLPLLLALSGRLWRGQRDRSGRRSSDTCDRGRIGPGCIAQDRFTTPRDEDDNAESAPHGATIAPRWRMRDDSLASAVTHPVLRGVQA